MVGLLFLARVTLRDKEGPVYRKVNFRVTSFMNAPQSSIYILTSYSRSPSVYRPKPTFNYRGGNKNGAVIYFL